MSATSRTKAAGGERELARVLTAAGFPARRGQPCPGLPGLHLAAQRRVRLDVYEEIGQAAADAGPAQVPAVCHRRAGRPWLVVLRLEDLLAIVRGGALAEGHSRTKPAGSRLVARSVLDDLGACGQSADFEAGLEAGIGRALAAFRSAIDRRRQELEAEAEPGTKET